MKSKPIPYIKTGILGFILSFLLWNCENEAGTLEAQPDAIATVSIDEAVNFFAEISSKPTKTAKKAYAIPYLSYISQEEIINSEALLTVIPATTQHGDHYSRILLLKINNEIQSLVFSMYASGNAAQEYFSGEILITNLQGGFLNGYRVENGHFVSQFRKKTESISDADKTGNVVCPEHGECNGESGCILCLQELDEVEVTGEAGGSGEGIEVYPELNDFPGIEEGGDGGPDMGMSWDYGPGEGVAPEDNEEDATYSCNCACEGNEDQWIDNLSENMEPKWGQLANKQELIAEINAIPGFDALSFEDQINALVDHFNSNLMYDINDSNEPYIIDPDQDVNKYVYTEVAGWLDFHHVFKLFKWAKDNGPFNAIIAGEMGETMQQLSGNNSAYSYEDLPSNNVGVAFFIRFGADIEAKNITWQQAVDQALTEMQWTEPEDAPNFDYIPYLHNEFYPKNFTYAPLLGEALKAYHKQKFCERPAYEQYRIKEVHEKFPR